MATERLIFSKTSPAPLILPLTNTLTWQLWDVLNKPPVLHPLFQRLDIEKGRGTWEQVRMMLWLGTAALTLVLLMVFPMIFFALLLAGPIIYAILNTVFFTALWVMDIAGTIAREMNRHTYDLECMMPVGRLCTNWIIATGRLHFRSALVRSMMEVGSVVQLLLFVLMFVSIGMLVTRSGREQIQLFVGMSILLVIMGYLYLDHIQSVITGICVSLITGQQTRTIGDARLWSLVCFMALQLAWYLGVLLTIVFVVPLLAQILPLAGTPFSALLPWVVLLLSAGLRELLIRFLWHWVITRSNAEQDDLFLLKHYI
jgi:hypothetical protein